MSNTYFPVPLFAWPAAPGGKLHTYAAGGTTPATTWQDLAGSVPNTNPVTLDSTGTAKVMGSGTYHFVLNDATDTTTLWDADNYSVLLYPQTAAEIAAGVTPVNEAYEFGNILRYGADPTGVADSTTAINNAIAAVGYGLNNAPTNQGARVRVPVGYYLIGAISISAYNNVHIVGDIYSSVAHGGCKFIANSASVNMLTIGVVGGITIENIAFFPYNYIANSAAVQTSGSYVTFAGSSNCRMKGCVLVQGYNLVSMTGAAGLIYCDDLNLLGWTNDAVFLNITGAGGSTIFTRIVADGQSAAPRAVFEINAHAGDFVLDNFNTERANVGLLMNPGAGQIVNWAYISNGNFDYSNASGTPVAGQFGVSMVPTGGGVVQGIFFTNVWTATAYVGFNMVNDGLSQIHDINLVNWFSVNNQCQGMVIDGAIDVNIVNPRVWANSAAASNTYSGILIQSSTAVGTNSIKITDGKIGGSEGGLTSAHKYNVEFGAGFTATINMNGVDIGSFGTSNTGGAGAPGGASSILQCPGYNPIGVSTGTVGASPALLGGGYSGGTYYFKQTGTNTATVSIGGNVIATMSVSGQVYPINLGPTETCTVTWVTNAPTFVLSQL
jgi:hypothetical protein